MTVAATFTVFLSTEACGLAAAGAGTGHELLLAIGCLLLLHERSQLLLWDRSLFAHQNYSRLVPAAADSRAAFALWAPPGRSLEGDSLQ